MFARFFPSVVFALGMVVLADTGAASAASTRRDSRPVMRFERLVYHGDSALASLAAWHPVPVLRPPEVRRKYRDVRPIDVRPAVRRHAAAIPLVVDRRVVPADADFFGFPGLTDVDQFNAGTGAYANSEFDLEPPDQALCAGNGFVVEAVENAVVVYTSAGRPLTAPTALGQLFGEPPAIIAAATRTYGPLLTEPQCYFDRDTQRWFLSEQEIDLDPQFGTYANHSAILLAVSRNGDPTAGYSVYAADTTNPANLTCPCYGDRPRLGADANGVYVSIDQFALHPSGLQSPVGSAQIYAMSKSALANHMLPTVVHIDAGELPNPDGALPWLSIQPATSPDSSAASRTAGGTEYFLSTVNSYSYQVSDNRIAVWALTNTESLRSAIPNLNLEHTVIGSEAYAQPPPAAQKAGPAPLGASLHARLEQLDTSDDRMNQVVFAGGRLWSALNTAVRSASGVDAGVAFFAVAPSFDRSAVLSAKIKQQGYIAVAGQNVMYPSIGVNARGGTVLAATLSGPAYYPTAVYVAQDGNVHIAGAGTGPEDGYSGYFPFTGSSSVSIANWGKYSAAVADGDGSVWIAAEFIRGGPRTLLTDWGTFIGHVRIQP